MSKEIKLPMKTFIHPFNKDYRPPRVIYPQGASEHIHDKFSRADTESYLILYKHLSIMWLSTDRQGAASLRYDPVTKIAPKSPFLCVNRNPIYGFRASAKAIWYIVNIALILEEIVLKIFRDFSINIILWMTKLRVDFERRFATA